MPIGLFKNKKKENEYESPDGFRKDRNKDKNKSRNKDSPPTPTVPEPPPAYSPPSLLDKPWRSLEWDKKKTTRDNLRNKILSSQEVKFLRILVHGPIGAGKSSFINSIDSIFQERITSPAIAEATGSGHSFTTAFQTHYIKSKGYGTAVPFAFCDIMGLEDGHSNGVKTEDLVKVLQGHIKDGYQFNPTSPCSEKDPHYNSNPQLKDRIHCLVSVIPANRISMMDKTVIDKMKEVRAQAARLRIPQLAILTKVDDTCKKVADNIRHIYSSKKIKVKMQECSNGLGVPMSCIFPVKCYHEEIQLNDDADVLLLSALSFILDYANDHVAVLASEIMQR